MHTEEHRMAWHGHGCVLERVERLVRAGLEELEEVLAKEQQEKEGESAVAGGASAAAAAATGAGAGRGMHSHWSRGYKGKKNGVDTFFKSQNKSKST